jgi:hypothetical protein
MRKWEKSPDETMLLLTYMLFWKYKCNMCNEKGTPRHCKEV